MPAGRPRIAIDQKIFENLCGIFCTQEEIAGVFNCSVDTIDKFCKRTYKCNFTEVYKIHSAKGKMSLRRWQMQAAERGNTSMLIFLGKNYLGQADVVRNEVSTDGKLADLIEGLKEPFDDLYEEATGANAEMAMQPAEAIKSA